MIYYLAQQNGINTKQGFAEFRNEKKQGGQPARTEADIMDEVKGILAEFNG